LSRPRSPTSSGRAGSIGRDRRYTVSRPVKAAESTLNSLEQARRTAALAQEKLGEDVVILDMRPVCSYTDFFVVCAGRNTRQTKAIWDEVRERLKRDDGLLPRSVDGEREGDWIIADYLDVVLHVFTPELRRYYDLEDLWGDVPAIELEAAAG
jgi:ribosome-associated protein